MYLKEWVDFIRRRPGMYIGSVDESGIGEIMENLLEELLLYRQGNPVLEINIVSPRQISLVIEGVNVRQFSDSFDWDQGDARFKGLGWSCLVALSETLYAEFDNGSGLSVCNANKGLYQLLATSSRREGERITIQSTFDKDIFGRLDIRFEMLARLLRKFAFLYPGVTIIVATTEGDQQRIVYRAPNGLVDELKELLPYDEWRYTRFSPFVLNASMGQYTIDVACCYHNMGNDQLVRTYANHRQMYLGGSLQEGVLSGIIAAGNRVANEMYMDIQLDRATVTRKLLLLAAIKGDNLSFCGSVKRELDMPDIETAIKQRMEEDLYSYLMNNEAAAWSFFHVFAADEIEEEGQ